MVGVCFLKDQRPSFVTYPQATSGFYLCFTTAVFASLTISLIDSLTLSTVHIQRAVLKGKQNDAQ